MHAKVPIRVRSTYSDGVGTLVTAYGGAVKGRDVQERLVTGIAHVPNVTQIKVLAKDGPYDLHAQVFKEMANEGISVDFINISPTGVAYTVSDDLADRAVTVLRAIGYEPLVARRCAKGIYCWCWYYRCPRRNVQNCHGVVRERDSNFYNQPTVIRPFGCSSRKAI
ncbi:hypothetical protein GCM10020331_048700 [Ectobacillus funiculus]